MGMKIRHAVLVVFATIIIHCVEIRSHPDYWIQYYENYPNPVTTVCPLSIFNANRFDIPAKYLYAYFHEHNIQSNWGLEIYAKHLRVWGNFQERYPRKTCLEDYIKAFNNTLASVKARGFDTTTSIIPMGKESLLDGAHRITASLLYKENVSCKLINNLAGHFITSDFFKKKGLKEKYLDAMAMQYCTLKDNSYIVVVWPAAKKKEKEVQSIIKKHTTIVYTKNIRLKNNGPFSFVEQIYADEPWVSDTASLHNQTSGCFPSGSDNYIRIFLVETNNPANITTSKQKIRNLFNIGNYAAHSTDTHKEALEIGKIVFNDNSIHFMNYRTNMRNKNFEKFFSQFKQWLKTINADKKLFCIDGSAVLAAYGLRDCRDLDFLHHRGNINTGSTNFDCHNHEARYYPTTIDDIIFNPSNHFYYKGIKFTSLDMVKKMKKIRNEVKDRQDVELINALLKKGKQ